MIDGHLDGAVFVDLRTNLEQRTHVFAFVGGEGVDGAVGARRVGVRTGGEGDVFAHHDAGFFVVQRHQVRGGEDVGIAITLHQIHQRTQAGVAIDGLGKAQVHALHATNGCGLTVGECRAGNEIAHGSGDAKDIGNAVDGRAIAQYAKHAAVVANDGAPLHAQLCGLVGRDFDDQCLDQHLRTAAIELVDDGA